MFVITKLTKPVYKWLSFYTPRVNFKSFNLLHTTLTMIGIFGLYNFSHAHDTVADSHCEF